MIYLATKTRDMIDTTIQKDQGAAFKSLQWKYMQSVPDAFNHDPFPFRSHLGASLIAGPCERALWYGFRWVTEKMHGGQLLRLFNRGHLEEARFLAMLEMIGINLVNVDNAGKQIRISVSEGHGGGSVDGVGFGVPELGNTPCLTEFKTHGEKSFLKLLADGVRLSKPVHYGQVQTYMGKLQLPVCLYMAVNKNNDHLYAELIPFDEYEYRRLLARFDRVILSPVPLPRISNTPSWYECKMCDHNLVCWGKVPPMRNCRTCAYAQPIAGGQWACNFHRMLLDKQQQLAGCNNHNRIPTINV